MWFDKLLTTLRGLEGRIISFIDLSACDAGQPEVIKHLGLWEESHANAGSILPREWRENLPDPFHRYLRGEESNRVFSGPSVCWKAAHRS